MLTLALIAPYEVFFLSSFPFLPFPMPKSVKEIGGRRGLVRSNGSDHLGIFLSPPSLFFFPFSCLTEGVFSAIEATFSERNRKERTNQDSTSSL